MSQPVTNSSPFYTGFASKVLRLVLWKMSTESSPQSGEMFIAMRLLLGSLQK